MIADARNFLFLDFSRTHTNSSEQSLLLCKCKCFENCISRSTLCRASLSYNSGCNSHVFLKAIHVVTWDFTLCLIHTAMLQYCFTHHLCSRNRTVPPLQPCWPNSNSWLVEPRLLSCLSSGRATQQVVLPC